MNGYIHPNNFKKQKNKPLGLCPKPHSHLRGRRGRWQTLSTYPYGECWVDSKASRVKCDFVALDPSPSPWGVAKLTEADGLETCQGLRSNRVAAPGLWVGGDNAICGKGAGGFPAPLPRGERGCGQRPGCWQDPWGRAVEKNIAVGTHLRVLGLQGTEPALCSLAWLSGDRWAHVGSVAKALPHAPCAPLSLDNLQVLVQNLPMAFG